MNVKLDKSGGILNAYMMQIIAKALGMKTMLGCMISSSCTVTAAAHLSPLVDYADLDGNLFIANDPYHGVGPKREAHSAGPAGIGIEGAVTRSFDKRRAACPPFLLGFTRAAISSSPQAFSGAFPSPSPNREVHRHQPIDHSHSPAIRSGSASAMAVESKPMDIMAA